MFIHFFRLIILLSVISNNALSNAIRSVYLKNEFLGNCPNFENGPMKLTNVIFQQSTKDKYIITANVLLNTNLSKNLQSSIKVNRCKFDMKDCEVYLDLFIPEFCGKLIEPNKIWSPISNLTEPQFRCPFTQQVYKLTYRTGMISYSQYLNMLPVKGFKWSITIQIFEELNSSAGGVAIKPKSLTYKSNQRVVLCLYARVSTSAMSRSRSSNRSSEE